MAFGSVLQHNIGRGEPSGGVGDSCAGCSKPILDKFLLNVLERGWHASCVRCCECLQLLTDKCFSREAKLYCKNDFFRRYGTKCSGCGQGIAPSDLVRKPRDKVFHLNCFTCCICRKQLSTGEQLYVLDDNKFICKEDYMLSKGHLSLSDSLMGSGSEDDDDDDLHIRNSVSTIDSGGTESSCPMGVSELSVQTMNSDSKHAQDDSDQGSLDGEHDGRVDLHENKSPDDGTNGSKRRGPRTTIKAKQLEVLKTAFSQTPKPTRHIREQLAKETGLPMRVIQVWFQNKRSKERRLKQLTSMGRGPFFSGARKIRGFPMNIAAGALDEGTSSVFPYFSSDVKFEYGYNGPFHAGDSPFYAGHPVGPLPYSAQGIEFGYLFGRTPLEPGGHLPLLNEFSVNSDSNFISGPSINSNNTLTIQQPLEQHSGNSSGPRPNSPNFIASGNFSEAQNMQNEGLVW